MRVISGLLLAASILALGGTAQALTVDEAKTIGMDAYLSVIHSSPLRLLGCR